MQLIGLKLRVKLPGLPHCMTYMACVCRTFPKKGKDFKCRYSQHHVAQKKSVDETAAVLFITTSGLHGKFPQLSQTATFFMFALTCTAGWAVCHIGTCQIVSCKLSLRKSAIIKAFGTEQSNCTCCTYGCT